ncbi:MAG: GNAT family N-acetyltransferase [Gemmatimonadaceae bacterium]
MTDKPSDVRITTATEDDVPLILDFIRLLAEYERLGDACVATAENLHRTLFTATPAAEVIIATVAGEPVGFALFFHNYSTFLAQRGIHLEDLFVSSSARGHGVGRALLAALAQIAIDRDCGRLEWVVLDWNDLAISFYRNIGATPIEEWTTFRMTGDPLRSLAAEATT